MRLRGIGFWRDPGKDDPYHHPMAFVDRNWSRENREEIARFLESGVIANQYRGYSSCRFDCGVPMTEMGSADLSDGTWGWPEGLAHYVREHSVRLPAEFLERAKTGIPWFTRFCLRARHSNMLTRLGLRFSRPISFDMQFWIKWGDAHADPATGYRETEEAERRAQILWQAEWIREEILRVENETGLGEETCKWRDCTDGALKGRARCPWHAVVTPLPESMDRAVRLLRPGDV